MSDTPDYSAEITVLEAILNSGAKSVSTDGLATQFDLDAVRKRRDELVRLQGGDLKMVRPRISSVYLGSAW